MKPGRTVNLSKALAQLGSSTTSPKDVNLEPDLHVISNTMNVATSITAVDITASLATRLANGLSFTYVLVLFWKLVFSIFFFEVKPLTFILVVRSATA